MDFLGLGSGAGAALLAEICRTTSPKERTSVLSFCSGLRQVGLLIGISIIFFTFLFLIRYDSFHCLKFCVLGPGFQIILEYFDFTLFGGSLVVRPFNAPGLFMTVLWIVFLVFVMAFYQNLDVEYHYEILRREHDGLEIPGHSIELSTSRDHLMSPSDEWPSIAARRWYFIEENFDKQTVAEPATFSTYIDGTLKKRKLNTLPRGTCRHTGTSW
jgi:hypothetical protein